MLSTLTCMTRRQFSGGISTTLPRPPIPTLLSRQSSRPNRSTAAATIALACWSSVTSATKAAAVPPSSAIIATVRSARLSSRSTTSTRAPARASRIAAARPLPMPSSSAPPPVTIATLPSRPKGSSRVAVSAIRLLPRSAGVPPACGPEARGPELKRCRAARARGRAFAAPADPNS